MAFLDLATGWRYQYRRREAFVMASVSIALTYPPHHSEPIILCLLLRGSPLDREARSQLVPQLTRRTLEVLASHEVLPHLLYLQVTQPSMVHRLGAEPPQMSGNLPTPTSL